VPLPPEGDFDTFLADIMELEFMIDKYQGLLEEETKTLNKKFHDLFI
jgi:hypothetical protein